MSGYKGFNQLYPQRCGDQRKNCGNYQLCIKPYIFGPGIGHLLDINKKLSRSKLEISTFAPKRKRFKR